MLVVALDHAERVPHAPGLLLAMAKTKRCSGCGLDVDVTQFPLDRGRRRTLCNVCFNQRRRMKYGSVLELEDDEDEDEAEELTPVEEHRLKAKNANLAAQIKSLMNDLSTAQLIQDVVKSARSVKVAPITPRERKSGLLEGTCQVLASDWHVEEQVRPEQVAGRNRYNLEIAQSRMEKFFEATSWGVKFNRQAYKIRDLILWLGGDFITNHLHPDNVETNLLSPPEALAYVHAALVTGIRYLLQDKELERIVVPCNDGNHGRMTDKMRSSSRCAMSLETMLYGFLAREFEKEPRVQFIIAQGSHLYYEVYGRTIRYVHGDETKYGGGVGGITVPIYRAMAKWQTVRQADLTCLGHYHQRISLNDLICNGCFESGCRVLTDHGPQPIELVAVGERVLSQDGTFQTVEHVASRIADDVIRLRVKGLPNYVVCTPNHEIWAIKGESSTDTRPSRVSPRAQTSILQETPAWYRAEHLSEGDWIHTPCLKGTQEMDLELLFAYGVFLAEGHTIVEGGTTNRHHRIEFTMHIEEEHILEQIKATLDLHLQRTHAVACGQQNAVGRLWTREDRTTSQLSYTGRELARWFRDNFGHLAVGKKVPSWMLELSPQCRQAVVQGWIEGDGHRGKCVTAVSISENLAWGMYLMAIGTGLEPMLYGEGVTKIAQGEYTPRWRVSFVVGQDVRWVGGERYLRIDHRRRERRITTVHDLQVSGNHTYCVEGYGVHNSLIGYSPYSLTIGARFEPPAQDLTMLDSKRFKGLSMPLWVSSTDDDDHQQQRKPS